jgi:hypothetical protein
MFNFDIIRANTVALRTTPTPSALEAHIARSFGCNRADVLTLVNLMRSEDGKPALGDTQILTQTGRPPIGTLVVIRNRTVLITSSDSDGDRRFTRANGSSGINALRYISSDEPWTPATDAQIDEFINEYR